MVHVPSKESVAYDFARFDNRRTVREAAEPVKTPKARKKNKKSAITASMVITYFIVLFMSGIIVYNYMHLTLLADQSAKLEKQYEGLKSEETLMHAEREKMFNLNYIEEYARNKLKMVKADENQINYVQMSKPDQVSILKDEKTGASDYFAGFIKTFNVVVEYLN